LRGIFCVGLLVHVTLKGVLWKDYTLKRKENQMTGF